MVVVGGGWVKWVKTLQSLHGLLDIELYSCQLKTAQPNNNTFIIYKETHTHTRTFLLLRHRFKNKNMFSGRN